MPSTSTSTSTSLYQPSNTAKKTNKNKTKSRLATDNQPLRGTEEEWVTRTLFMFQVSQPLNVSGTKD
jgi:hypothetical protein